MSDKPHGALWASIGNWIQQGFSLFTVLVVARLLDPVSFGLLGTALIFVLLAQRILVESFGYAVIQKVDTDASYLDTVFTLSTVFGILFSVLLFFGGNLLAIFFEEPKLASVLGTLAIIPAIDGLANTHTALLRKEARFKSLAMRTLYVNTFGAMLSVLLAFWGFGVWALVVQQIIQAIGNLIVTWQSHSWRPRPNFSASSARDVTRFGTPMIINAVVFVLSNRIDVLALSAFAGAGPTGVYTMAKRLARSITDILVSGISAASLSALSGATLDIRSKCALLIDQLKFATWLAFPAFSGVALVAPDIVPILLGDKWSEVSGPMRYLCLFGALQIPLIFGSNLLISMRLTSKIMMLNILALVVLAVGLITSNAETPTETAIVFSCQAALSFLSLLYILKKYTEISPLQIIAAMTPSLLMSISSITIAVLMASFLRNKYDTGAFANISIYTLSFSFTYISLSFFFHRNMMMTLVNKIARRSC